MSSIFNIIYSNIYPIALSMVISFVFYKLINNDSEYKDSKYIDELRENTKIIKTKLTIDGYCPGIRRYVDINHFRFKEPIKTGPDCGPHNLKLYYQDIKDKESFFRYCYYINLHEDKDDINKLFLDDNMLTICKNTNDYSAITSVILAECVTVEEQRKFISILLSYGFKINKHDKLFAKLHVYESIPDIIKNKILLFLSNDIILPEIAYYIINCLVDNYVVKYDPIYIY